MINFLRKRTPKFYYLQRSFGQKRFSILDVGAGNHSASKTKKLFPNCEYHGIDHETYNNDRNDFFAMDDFYKINLTLLQFKSIPDNYFDFIRMSHVIEHLYNGDKVIEHLIPKLKSGGFIYIEYPGMKSTKLPHMDGSLNFYDDPTHVRVYSVRELTDLFKNNNFSVISSGTRRNLIFLAAMPFRIIKSLIRVDPMSLFLLKRGKLNGNIFWDLLGFSEYVYAQKN